MKKPISEIGYSAPEAEVVSIETEAGFAVSGGLPADYDPVDL